MLQIYKNQCFSRQTSIDIFSDVSQKSKFIKLKDATYENFHMFFIRKNVNFIHEKIKNFSWIIKWDWAIILTMAMVINQSFEIRLGYII